MLRKHAHKFVIGMMLWLFGCDFPASFDESQTLGVSSRPLNNAPKLPELSTESSLGDRIITSDETFAITLQLSEGDLQTILYGRDSSVVLGTLHYTKNTGLRWEIDGHGGQIEPDASILSILKKSPNWAAYHLEAAYRARQETPFSSDHALKPYTTSSPEILGCNADPSLCFRPEHC